MMIPENTAMSFEEFEREIAKAWNDYYEEVYGDLQIDTQLDTQLLGPVVSARKTATEVSCQQELSPYMCDIILRWEQDARDIQAFEWLRENL